MVRHDLECNKCGAVHLDVLVDPTGPMPNCHKCVGGTGEIVFLPTNVRNAACHSAEACVVYYSAKEGKYQYPARNDIPIPGRLAARGYEKVEMRSIHDIQRFEKRNNVVNEAVWYDKGSGRGYENDGQR